MELSQLVVLEVSNWKLIGLFRLCSSASHRIIIGREEIKRMLKFSHHPLTSVLNKSNGCIFTNFIDDDRMNISALFMIEFLLSW